MGKVIKIITLNTFEVVLWSESMIHLTVLLRSCFFKLEEETCTAGCYSYQYTGWGSWTLKR